MLGCCVVKITVTSKATGQPLPTGKVHVSWVGGSENSGSRMTIPFEAQGLQTELLKNCIAKGVVSSKFCPYCHLIQHGFYRGQQGTGHHLQTSGVPASIQATNGNHSPTGEVSWLTTLNDHEGSWLTTLNDHEGSWLTTWGMEDDKARALDRTLRALSKRKEKQTSSI